VRLKALVPALPLALGLFSVIPVPGRSQGRIDRSDAARALLWLPLVGALLGGLAMLPALAVWRGGAHGSTLLAATLALTAMALLTRGLHLDGLADLADGLGSRRPSDQALTVMSQSDIGPVGVVAVVLSLLLQVAALSAILQAGSRPAGVVAYGAATMIGRLTAVWAAGRTIPAAREGGFGAMVAGSTSWPARVAITGLVFVTVAGLAWWAGADGPGLLRLGGACAAGLVFAWGLRRHAVRRLGGMTGDVFGALIEVATTVTLVVLAGALTWR
jgi:adenosylcobinamide-GDP ribazoletransferase